MVAQNPLFAKWSMKRFNATVINDIWPEVAFFTLVATMVTVVSEKKYSLAISNQMLTVLGLVLGLVVSFRTSSAYERYGEGRKLWTNITISSRNLAQMIWLHVPVERVDQGRQKKQSALHSIIEKKTMINLVQAFSVSVKHVLRGEPGIFYQDLYPLICFLPRYATHPPAMQTDADLLPMWHEVGVDDDQTKAAKSEVAPSRTPSSLEKGMNGEEEKNPTLLNSQKKGLSKRKATFAPERVLPVVESDKPLKPARNPPEASIYDYIPFLRIVKPLIKLFRPSHKENDGRDAFGRKKQPEMVESNIPLEITLFLSSYQAWLLRAGLLQPAIATGIMNNIGTMQDAIANLERIRNTPLPFAYQAHLRMSMWLYLFFLPFQVYSAYKWLTIPATAFAAFLLLGFLEIGQEIENPFNYDLNDLDLDDFCLTIQREMHQITAHTSPDPERFLFGAFNQPFAPADRRTAEQILNTHSATGPAYCVDEEADTIDDNERGLTSVRRTLLKSWKTVDMMTRHHK